MPEETTIHIEQNEAGYFQGILKDWKRWWLGADGSKEDREVRALLMSRDRGKRGVKKKRFQ
jgi:hypothetical protein